MRNHTNATTPKDYIAQLEEPRKSDIKQLDTLIRQAVPHLTPCICYGMLGYGPYHYKYASGHEGDTAIISLASQKNYISLYINAWDAKGYLAERYKTELPKANIGKSCIRFKKLTDVDTAVLAKIIRAGAALMATA